MTRRPTAPSPSPTTRPPARPSPSAPPTGWPAKKTFTYALAKQGVAGTCTDYTNTAAITETAQSDKQLVTVCVGKDLVVAKTAAGTFDRTYFWAIDKSVDDTRIEIAQGGTATFNYTIKLTPGGYTDSGWTLAGKITVTNPNDWQAITADVADSYDGGGVCTVAGGTAVSIPAGQSVTLDYSCVFGTKPLYTGVNTATATWDKAAAFTPSGSASGKADVTLTLDQETNRTVTVLDDKTTGTPVTLGTSDYYAGPFTFTYALAKQGVAGTCTDYTNTASLKELPAITDSQKVTVCVGKDLAVTKTAAGTFNRAYLWSIAKAVDVPQINIANGGTATFNYTVTATQTGIADSGWTLAGKITVTNPNDWEAITVDVTDAVNNGGVCTVAGGTAVSIPAGGAKTFDYTCTYAAAPTAYSGANTATATWDKAAAFTPDGSATGSAAFTLTQAGSTNKTVTVTDSLGGTLGTVTATDAAPFAAKSFTYSYGFKGEPGTCKTYDNTATLTETGQTASKTVKVCVGKDLTVTKTAVASYDRLYKWKIAKSVDKTSATVAPGENAAFNYTVTVTPDGFTDSGWKLSGKITVTNPNDWEAITANVTDATNVGGGAVCTVTGGANVSIPAGKSVTLDYSCTFTGQPAYTGTNTATVTWNKATYFTPGETTTGTAAVSFTVANETNKTITVVDNKTGATDVTLGTASWPDGVKSFTYTLTKSKASGTGACTSYTNIAKIKETGQTATQTVQVCVIAIDLVKQIGTSAAGPWYDSISQIMSGMNVWYKFTVTNTGDVTLTNVTVTDPMFGGQVCVVASLAPGANTTCSKGPVQAAYNNNSQVCNTATASGSCERQDRHRHGHGLLRDQVLGLYAGLLEEPHARRKERQRRVAVHRLPDHQQAGRAQGLPGRLPERLSEGQQQALRPDDPAPGAQLQGRLDGIGGQGNAAAGRNRRAAQRLLPPEDGLQE